MNNPLPAHYWVAEGTGEISSHWFRPICKSDGSVRRHTSDFDSTPRPDAPVKVCAECELIINAIPVKR